VRPAGRPPIDGYRWNHGHGVWVPGKRLQKQMEQELLLNNGKPVNAREHRVGMGASTTTDDHTQMNIPLLVWFYLGHASAVPCLPSDLAAVPREDWEAFWCRMDYQHCVVQRCDFVCNLLTYAFLGCLVALLIFAHSAVHIGHCAAIMPIAALVCRVLDTVKNATLLRGIQEACRHEQQRVFQKYGFFTRRTARIES
jgi:hypothetical protein